MIHVKLICLNRSKCLTHTRLISKYNDQTIVIAFARLNEKKNTHTGKCSLASYGGSLYECFVDKSGRSRVQMHSSKFVQLPNWVPDSVLVLGIWWDSEIKGFYRNWTENFESFHFELRESEKTIRRTKMKLKLSGRDYYFGSALCQMYRFIWMLKVIEWNKMERKQIYWGTILKR